MLAMLFFFACFDVGGDALKNPLNIDDDGDGYSEFEGD